MADYIGKAFAEEPELRDINRDFAAFVKVWEDKYGGGNQAAQYARDWYDATLDDKDDTGVETFSDQEFTWGKMFKFNYDPMTKDRLSYYDKSPMILSFGKAQNGKYELGLNLNYFPKVVRYWMVGEIFKYYEQDIVAAADGKNYRRAYEQLEVQMDYELVQKQLGKWGIDFALRQYNIGNTRDLSVVCYEDWVKMVMIDWNDYDPIQESEIHQLYQDFVMKAMKKN